MADAQRTATTVQLQVQSCRRADLTAEDASRPEGFQYSCDCDCDCDCDCTDCILLYCTVLIGCTGFPAGVSGGARAGEKGERLFGPFSFSSIVGIDADIYGARKESNFRVIRWLDKVLTVVSTV